MLTSAVLPAADLDFKVAHAQAGEAGVHRAAFTAAEVAVQADGRGGLYDLALLVGDAAVANPIEWRLGQVSTVTIVPSFCLTAGARWRPGWPACPEPGHRRQRRLPRREWWDLASLTVRKSEWIRQGRTSLHRRSAPR